MAYSQISDQYKNEADIYSKFSRSSFSWKYIERPAFDKYLSKLLKRRTRVLDAGCGEGRTIDYLIGKGIDPKNIVGIDSSKSMLAIAKSSFFETKLINDDISIFRSDLKNFDLIISCMVLFYLNPRQLNKALRNFCHYLHKGGKLFYITGHPFRLVEGQSSRYLQRGKVTLDTPWGTKMKHYHHTIADFVNATIRAGFKLDYLDEPKLTGGEEENQEEFVRYSSYPSRLVVLASKS